MEPAPRPSFEPAWAGALLLAGVAVCAGIGALIGWVAGRLSLGLIVGVVVGIPAGVAAVYLQYRDVLS